MARIGIFGGTFNPIHTGHLMLVEEALRSGGLDRILLVPSGESYLKDQSQIASREDRLAMAQLAAGSILGPVEVSEVETRREGPSYTADTLRELRAEYPEDELTLMIGADSLLELSRWREPEVILGLASLMVFTRGGQDGAELERAAEALRRERGARIRLMEAFTLTLSSSQIRGLIREGHAFGPLVTAPVRDYIMSKGLYGWKEKRK